MKNRIVLLGPPAAGKGTQAEFIQKRFGQSATSTGAILRDEAKRGSTRGRLCYDIISKGGLAPDDLVIGLVAAWVSESRKRFLFDGFPRTLAQASSFEQILMDLEAPLDLAILIDLPEPVIRLRMSTRLVCSVCGKIISLGRHVQSSLDLCPNCGGVLEHRVDDTELVLKKRLIEYQQKTLPVTNFYSKSGLLARVDGNTEAGPLADTIAKLIEQ